MEDILSDIDFSNAFNVLEDLIKDCKIKKFRRKFRHNNKITYTKYFIVYNPVKDLFLDNLSFGLKHLNKIMKDD